MKRDHRRHGILRGVAGTLVLVLVAGVPSLDGPDFALDTTLFVDDIAFAESLDFTAETYSTPATLDFAESDAFALDTTAINRAWADSEAFPLDTSDVKVSPDCNGNGKVDSCDISDRTSTDCNRNGDPDECDIRDAISRDCVIVNGIPDECEGFGHWCPAEDEDQLRDGEDPQAGNVVSLEHLWEWSDDAGRFVDPKELGRAGVTVDPTEPTYLLTHGWDGSLDGISGGEQCAEIEYAMSSIGCAIYEATSPPVGTGVNLLAWDWKLGANPNSDCDFPDKWSSPLMTVLWRPLQTALKPIAVLVHDNPVIQDAWLSGLNAQLEGIKLGNKLAALLDDPNSMGLGAQVHLIGKSHGGGVLGAAAARLNVHGHPVTSLSTLDTPHTLCDSQRCWIDSLSYVNPSAIEARVANYYYDDRLAGGLGAPLAGNLANVTNLSLNASHRSTWAHTWIAGPNNGLCPAEDGWFPVSVWNGARNPPEPNPLVFLDPTPVERTVLDVTGFPRGAWLEGNRNVFTPTGACCIPLIIPFGTNTCVQVHEDECGPLSVFLGNGTVCLGGFTDPACGGTVANSIGTFPSVPAVPAMSLIRYEPFESAATWFGNLTQLVIGADPMDATNRVILMQEQGDASFFRDIEWPPDAVLMTFDYLFREPRGEENLTVYVDNQIVYYDNAEISLARDRLTSSGAIYVGNVAGRTARLNFVLRTDQPEGGEFGGELVIDNVRVYGFLEHDADLDGDRDLMDFATFQRCFQATPMPDECWGFDVNGDNSVDTTDYEGDSTDPPMFTGFTQVFGSPAFPPTP